MAKNRKDRDSTPASTATARSTSSTMAAAPPATPTRRPVGSGATTGSSSSSLGSQNWDQVLGNIYNNYVEKTPQRTKLIDVFLAFLAVCGIMQFLYCVLAGSYPFNAFLAGFSSTVGQFVLTASLRIQTAAANKKDFPSVSPERAFADFIVCSLILHFFCVNFIN